MRELVERDAAVRRKARAGDIVGKPRVVGLRDARILEQRFVGDDRDGAFAERIRSDDRARVVGHERRRRASTCKGHSQLRGARHGANAIRKSGYRDGNGVV